MKKKELEDISWNLSETKVSFGLLYNHRLQILRLAYERFKDKKALDAFCKKNSGWLPDFSRVVKLMYVSVSQPHTTQHLHSTWVQTTDSIGITSTLHMTFPC